MNINTLVQIKNNFRSELQKASAGKSTSLPFIRHMLPKLPLVKSGNDFQVFVIGGSIFKSAVAKKVADKIEIENISEESLPSFHTKSEFLALLEKHISPSTEVLVLNLAYPLSPVIRDGRPDGIFVTGSKENKFAGLVGQKVGEEIEKYVENVLGRHIRVCVANDAICLLISGLTENKWDEIVAGIVGTGLNFALFLDQYTAVNLESGDFANFILSDEAKEIDKLSSSPGKALFEKETSGAYIYKHFNLLAKKRNINEEINSSEELSRLLTHENREVAAIAREVLDHSASLVAAQIAGILEFAKRDLTFTMQGSLFWRADGYKESVKKNIVVLSPDYRATFLEIPQADILGAAKLVL